MKDFKYITFLLATLIVTMFVSSCNSNSVPAEEEKEDATAKKMLQGTWINEIEGDVVFHVEGDTIFYTDSISTPAAFSVIGDTLIIRNHKIVKYPIRKLNSSNLVFVNAEGDEVELVKSDDSENNGVHGEYKGAVNLNQGRKVKADSVMTCGGKHYHAYTQVNPTTYKVYIQTTNEDGLSVESVYYDNIIHIALYSGQQRVFGQNFEKSSFKAVVPQSYLEKAVLSEIRIDKATEKGVNFIAVLTIPESYTNYRVNILVTPEGKKFLSV